MISNRSNASRLTTMLFLFGIAQLAWSQEMIEQIIVARSYREYQLPVTDFCAEDKIGFVSGENETRFSFWAVQIPGINGVVENPKTSEIGYIHTCFGPHESSGHVYFYGEGSLNGIPYKGSGMCFRQDTVPEAGITLFTCALEFFDLPEEFMGGRLTTNTLNSRVQFGDATDPPGYTQQSIATVRLWRKR